MRKFIKRNMLIIGMCCFLFLVFIFFMIVLSLFWPNKSVSLYGNRLDDIKKIELDSNLQTTLESNFSDYNVKSSYNIEGRLIDVSLKLNNYVDESKAMTDFSEIVLNSLSDEVKNYYDIELFITYVDAEKTEESDKSYVKIGYKNKNSSRMVFAK
ncbi:MAG: hypothetical protein ACK5HL_03015 [Bacilli bacterium]